MARASRSSRTSTPSAAPAPRAASPPQTPTPATRAASIPSDASDASAAAAASDASLRAWAADPALPDDHIAAPCLRLVALLDAETWDEDRAWAPVLRRLVVAHCALRDVAGAEGGGDV